MYFIFLNKTYIQRYDFGESTAHCNGLRSGDFGDSTDDASVQCPNGEVLVSYTYGWFLPLKEPTSVYETYTFVI